MDLTTVAKVKRRMGLTRMDDDEALKELVESVSAEAARVMRRTVQTASRTEYQDTTRGQRLVMVPAWPITSVTSVAFDPDGLWDSSSDTLTASTDYDLIRSGERGEIALKVWVDDQPNALKVVYTGGMAADTAAFVEAYPDIASAVTDQVVYQFQNRHQLGQTSVSAQGASVSMDGDTGFLTGVMKVLTRHRRSI